MKIFKLSMVLLLVCAIVAGILGVVDFVTRDKIAEQQALKTARAYAAVLEAENYEDVAFDAAAFPTIDNIAAADDKGHVVMSTFSGAQGMITMVVGVDNELTCTGISITSHSETSGLGANAASASEVGKNFRAQFVGQDMALATTKTGGSIEIIAGATITTNAIVGAVAECIAAVESIQGGKAA